MTLRRIALSLGLLCLAPLAAGCAASKPATVQAPAAGRQAPVSAGAHHRVGEGQTLWRIARVYGVDLETLARVNGISDPAALDVGTVLLVPGAAATLEVPPYPQPLPELGQPGTQIAQPLSLAWPVDSGRVLSGFGDRRGARSHRGLDIAGRAGDPVGAALDGRVVYTGSTLSGYGKTVVLDHGGGWSTLYAHSSELLVKEGDWVHRGQRIARVGRTGNATTEHCHFEVRRQDVPVDPLRYLDRAVWGSR